MLHLRLPEKKKFNPYQVILSMSMGRLKKMVTVFYITNQRENYNHCLTP